MTIRNIQAMRGIACLLVFCIHALVTHGGMGVDTIAWYFYPLGSAGVDIFFVISGFIITSVATRSADEPSPALRFGLRRLIRIYPIYWIVFAIAVVASHHIFLAPEDMAQPSLWKEALLLTHNNTKILAAWSLAFEIYFYFVVTFILFIAPKRFLPILWAWCAATLAASIYAAFFPTDWEWYEQIPQSPLIIEFMFGVAIAGAVRLKILPFGATALFLGCVGLFVGCDVIRINALQALPPWWRVLCFGAPSALMVYGVIAIEIRRGWTLSLFWQRLGDASYSLYIWHQLLFFALLAACERLHLIELVPGPVLILLWAAIVFPVGFLSYRRLERPMTRWLTMTLAPDVSSPRDERDTSNRPAVEPEWCELLSTAFDRPLSTKFYRSLRNGVFLTLAVSLLLFGSRMEVETIHDRAILDSIDRLGKHLSEARQTTTQLDAKAEMNGLIRDENFTGCVDALRRNASGSVHVLGWAWDAKGASPDIAALVFYNGQYRGATLTRARRPDVAAALRHRFWLFLRPGFNAALGPLSCEPDGVLAVMLVAPDRRFKMLPPPSVLSGCGPKRADQASG